MKLILSILCDFGKHTHISNVYQALMHFGDYYFGFMNVHFGFASSYFGTSRWVCECPSTLSAAILGITRTTDLLRLPQNPDTRISTQTELKVSLTEWRQDCTRQKFNSTWAKRIDPDKGLPLTITRITRYCEFELESI